MEGFFSTFRSPGAELIIGPITLRWYGILIAISVLIGLNLAKQIAARKGLKSNLINDFFPILVFSSVIGARLYYVIFEWRNYFGENFWSSFNAFGQIISIPTFLEIWRGGIAIHGALIAGALSLAIFCKLKNQPFWDLLDTLLPSVALGQAIGRWGNFFNNEAFGLPTELPWKLFIPFAYRSQIFPNNSFFHPTFLYESIWNILVFILLISLFLMSLKGSLRMPTGALSCIYLITYSIGRFWIEGLRIDPLCLGGVPPFCLGGIRMAQLVSMLLFGLGFLGLFWIYIKKRKMPDLTKIGARF